ncbi:hypothetical protein DL93DRAFT_2081847 [Clavulina sp. PMI_390]|nr:hypothetical protein DL93DRAFT_2081847 [Clavulina sp. PMI_390]
MLLTPMIWVIGECFCLFLLLQVSWYCTFFDSDIRLQQIFGSSQSYSAFYHKTLSMRC